MTDYHYETDPVKRKKVRLYSRCAVCGGKLWEFADEQGQAYLACKDNHIHGDKSHTGISRKPLDPNDNTIWRKRDSMVTTEKALSVAQYQTAVSLTEPEARKILTTIFPGTEQASPAEFYKALTLCTQYHLNPLKQHVFLVPFWNSEKKHYDYVCMEGIKATRLIASRKHHWTYLDDTPRMATVEEAQKHYGLLYDPENKYYFVAKMRDLDTGAEVTGWSEWNRYKLDKNGNRVSNEPKGTDKGNSITNMGCIRAERNMLDKAYPAEMPTGVEVMDERFVESAGNGSIEGDYRVMDETTGEITEPASTPEAGPEPEPANRDIVSEPQRRKLFAVANNAGIPMDDLKGIIKRRFNKDHSKDLTKVEASELIEKIEAGFILNMDTGEWTKS